MMHYYYSAMRQSSWHRTASRIRRKRLSGNADEGNRAAHAAIHAVENPIDVTGLIGCQENRHCGDIIRLAKPRRIQHVHKVRVHLRSRPSDFRWRLNGARQYRVRSEEHTSELQSLMRISYAVFCLKKKTSVIIFTYF